MRQNVLKSTLRPHGMTKITAGVKSYGASCSWIMPSGVCMHVFCMCICVQTFNPH